MKLTADELQLIEDAVRNRVIDRHSLPIFLHRLKNTPNRRDAVRNAIENTVSDRWARSGASVGRTIRGTDAAVDNFGQMIKDKGVLGTAAQIGWSAVKAPFQSAGEVLSGRRVEDPLQTILGGASVIPVGWGLAGIGARIGASAGRMGIAHRLGQAARSTPLRAAATGVETTDIFTSEENLIPELLLSAGTQFAGRLGSPPQTPASPSTTTPQTPGVTQPQTPPTQPTPTTQQAQGGTPPPPSQPTWLNPLQQATYAPRPPQPPQPPHPLQEAVRPVIQSLDNLRQARELSRAPGVMSQMHPAFGTPSSTGTTGPAAFSPGRQESQAEYNRYEETLARTAQTERSPVNMLTTPTPEAQSSFANLEERRAGETPVEQDARIQHLESDPDFEFIHNASTATRRTDNQNKVRQFSITFRSAFDKAVFMAARRATKPADKKRVKAFLARNNVSNTDIVSHNKRVVKAITQAAKGQQGGEIVIQRVVRDPSISSTTLYSDPITAAISEGGRAIGGAVRGARQRIQNRINTPQVERLPYPISRPRREQSEATQPAPQPTEPTQTPEAPPPVPPQPQPSQPTLPRQQPATPMPWIEQSEAPPPVPPQPQPSQPTPPRQQPATPMPWIEQSATQPLGEIEQMLQELERRTGTIGGNIQSIEESIGEREFGAAQTLRDSGEAPQHQEPHSMNAQYLALMDQQRERAASVMEEFNEQMSLADQEVNAQRSRIYREYDEQRSRIHRESNEQRSRAMQLAFGPQRNEQSNQRIGDQLADIRQAFNEQLARIRQVRDGQLADMRQAFNEQLARIYQARDEQLARIRQESAGAIILFSDPFTAAFHLGGQAVANAWRSGGQYLQNRAARRRAARAQTPSPPPSTTAPSGEVNSVSVIDSLVNGDRVTVGARIRSGVRGLRMAYQAGITDMIRRGEYGKELVELFQKHLQIDPQRRIANDRGRFMPHAQALDKLVRTRAKQTGNRNREMLRSDYERQVWDFIDENITINDPELAAIAVEMKEVIRQLNIETADAFLGLRRQKESEGKEVFIWDSNYKKYPWYPTLPGHTWVDSTMTFTRDSDGASLSHTDAINQSDKLYVPRYYPVGLIASNLKKTRASLAKFEVGKDSGRLPGFKQDKTTGKLVRSRDSKPFDDIESAYDAEVAFLRTRIDSLVVMEEAARSDASGTFGHLERVRETDDPFYTKDIALLIADRDRVWKLFGEIQLFDQRDPQTKIHAGYDKMVADFTNTPVTRLEEAVQPVVNHLLQFDKFEALESIDLKAPPKISYGIIKNWGTLDVERLKKEVPNLNLEYLSKIGLFKQKQDGTHEMGDPKRIFNVIGEYNLQKTRNKALIENVITDMNHWGRDSQANIEYNRIWRSVYNAITVLALTPFTTVRNLTEIGQLSVLTGPEAFAKGMYKFSTDRDVRKYGMKMASVWNQASRYHADGSNFLRRYLKWGIAYTGIEQFSRALGHIAGMEAARDAMRAYIASPNEKNASRLTHIRVDPRVVDNYVRDQSNSPDRLEDVFRESEQRDVNGHSSIDGVEVAGAPPGTNPHVDLIGDQLNRAGKYISDATFKEYNPLSLPRFLTDRHPMLRALLKFKAWQAQQHRFLYSQLKYAVVRGRKGDFRPAANLSSGVAAITLGGFAVQSLFDSMAGRDGPDGLAKGLLDGMASAGAFGFASTIYYLAQYADGNPYKAYQTLMNFGLGPVGSIFSGIVAPVVAGKPGETVKAVKKVFPGTREFERFGGWTNWGEQPSTPSIPAPFLQPRRGGEWSKGDN